MTTTESMCQFDGERDQVLVAYLYDEIDAGERSLFDAHLLTCAQCRGELSALRALRPALREWTPPEPAVPFVYRSDGAVDRRPRLWSRLGGIPVWTQIAAAMLVFGVSAAVANLNVRYDREGLSVRTGWSRGAEESRAGVAGNLSAPGARTSAPQDAVAAAPSATAADLAALEERLRNEFRAFSPTARLVSGQGPRPASSLSDAELLGRMRALVEESERRQQNELALRVADVMRDVDSQRRADLSKIDRNLGVIQTNTGVEVMKQRELLNYLVRVSQNK
jgi:anti-sigma factor RsiW